MSEFDLKIELENSKVVEKAIEKIEIEYEIQDVVKPKKMPALPENITEESPEVIGNMHSLYKTEVAWIRARLAIVEIQVRFCKQLIRFYRKSLYLAHRKNKVSAIDANAWVDIDNTVQKAEQDILGMEAERILLMARYDTFNDYVSIMSREITRRVSDWNDSGDYNKIPPGKRDGSGKRESNIKGKILKSYSKD